MSKKNNNFHAWLIRTIFLRIRWGFFCAITICVAYLLAFYKRTELVSFFGLDHSSTYLISCKPFLTYLNEFVGHYFPDLIAAFTIYLFIDQGIKILVGTREVRERNYKVLKRIFEYDVKKIDGEIRILDTFINNMILHIGGKETFTDLIKDRIKNNVKVKILLLNPSSEAAQQRISDLNKTSSYKDSKRKLGKEIKDNTVALFNFYKYVLKQSTQVDSELFEKADFLKIKFYDRTPPMSYYSWDDTAYFSLITPDSSTDLNPNMIVSSYSIFGNYVKSVFDKMWGEGDDSSEPVYVNPPISIDQFMLMKVNEADRIKNKIESSKNEIYLGYTDLHNKFPQFITSRTGNAILHKFLKENKAVTLIFQDKPVNFIITSILTEDSQEFATIPIFNFASNKYEDEKFNYNDAIEKINKLYSLSTEESKNYFHENPTIYVITTEKKIE